MFKYFAKLKEEIDYNGNTELEIRMPIIKPKNFNPDRKETITYYKCQQYKTLTFRSRNDNRIIETKEIYKKEKIKNFNLVLSIEQSHIKRFLKIQLIKSHERKIERQKISELPLVEIIKSEEGYMLEIEFDINTYFKVNDIIKQYKNKYWPVKKPMEISSKNLSKKINFNNEWAIAPKADGLHILIFENEKETIYIYDNGCIFDKNKNEKEIIIPNNVYEAELLENNKIKVFDCLMYDNKDIRKLNYISRRKYIKENKKEAYVMNDNIESLKEILDLKFDYKTDGFIITNITTNITYKSKPNPTVDLRYKNGYLFLENEIESTRECEMKLKENKIYEFDKNLNLIKIREDKSIANYKMPYDENPLRKITFGEGIPSLRSFHNKVKLELLKMIKNKNCLLDIGSGKGGDVDKWIKLKFKKVYAVDDKLELNLNNLKRNTEIIQIRKKYDNIKEIIEYNAVSILFVPWDKTFENLIINKGEKIIAIMDKPINYKCNIFECEITDKVRLKIKGTNTAEYVTEKIIKTNIDRKYEIKFDLNYGTKDEKILQKMYSYYYIY